MYHFEKKNSKKFFPEGPAKMFPRAPLWLSTGLVNGMLYLERICSVNQSKVKMHLYSVSSEKVILG